MHNATQGHLLFSFVDLTEYCFECAELTKKLLLLSLSSSMTSTIIITKERRKIDCYLMLPF